MSEGVSPISTQRSSMFARHVGYQVDQALATRSSLSTTTSLPDVASALRSSASSTWGASSGTLNIGRTALSLEARTILSTLNRLRKSHWKMAADLARVEPSAGHAAGTRVLQQIILDAMQHFDQCCRVPHGVEFKHKPMFDHA